MLSAQRFLSDYRRSRKSIFQGGGQADPVDILKNCISDFEGFANDLRDPLLKIPATKKRKTDLSKVNFQNVLDAILDA